jgi:hypothetical protein
MTTAQERELIQLWGKADNTGKALMMDLLLCFTHCGEEFLQEIQAAQENVETMKAVIAKWVATVKERGEG